MYDQILFPTDGSEIAERAVEQAIDVAKKYDALLHILYVVDETAPILNVRGSDESLDRLESEGAEIVREAVERAERASVTDVTDSVRRGEPAQAILEYIDANGIDLVVMGTHGRSGFDRHLLGSVTEKVVRHSNASVLTVRKTEGES